MATPDEPKPIGNVLTDLLNKATEKAKASIDLIVETCKKIKLLRGSFVETEVECGKDTHVTASNIQNITPGSNVTFKILRERDKKSIATANCNLQLDTCRVLWPAKQPADSRADDKYIIDPVSADGVSVKGTNTFSFKSIATTGSDSISLSTPRHIVVRAGTTIQTDATTTPPTRFITQAAGTAAPFNGPYTYGLTGRYDLELQEHPRKIIASLRIRFTLSPGVFDHDGTPPTGTAPTLTAAQVTRKETLLKEASRILTDANIKLRPKWCRHGAACTCIYPVEFKVEESSTNPHQTVKLYVNSIRANALNWSLYEVTDNTAATKTTRSGWYEYVWAHECGHLFGWPDEYRGGAIDGRLLQDLEVRQTSVVPNPGTPPPATITVTTSTTTYKALYAPYPTLTDPAWGITSDLMGSLSSSSTVKKEPASYNIRKWFKDKKSLEFEVVP